MKGCTELALCVAAMSLAGCVVAPSRATMGVRDADAAMVSHCIFVGYVTGASGFSGVAADVGAANAQNAARKKAAKLGANYIVWSAVHSGWGSGAAGNAYRCTVANK